MARLLSLNVGLPRDVAWQGRTVHTAVLKEPVQGRRIVRRLPAASVAGLLGSPSGFRFALSCARTMAVAKDVPRNSGSQRQSSAFHLPIPVAGSGVMLDE